MTTMTIGVDQVNSTMLFPILLAIPVASLLAQSTEIGGRLHGDCK
jgi:hypothetical protein